MNALAHLVLFGWTPLVLLLFLLLRPRLAVLTALAGGSLFLPQLSIDVPGPVNIGKQEVLCFAALLGVVLFDRERLTSYRPRLIDLPIVLWIAAAAAASGANDLGDYDAFASALTRAITWGIPYLLGVVYLASREGLRDLLWVFFLSGLAYVPFCLFEVRMSPQLHYMVYGASQHAFDQTIRGGGYRPMVFMSHGLELSLWMAAATLAGVVLLRSRLQSSLLGFRLWPFVVAVGVTTVLCKSTGAIFLGAVGWLLISGFSRPWHRATILLLVPVYFVVRWAGDGSFESLLVDLSRMLSEDRAGSLKFRFDNEEILLARAAEKPLFGFGNRDFGLISDPETGEALKVVTDSFWIIVVATNGLLGLAGYLGLLWVPAMRGFNWLRMRSLPRLGDYLGASMILTALVFDSLVNAFVPPLYVAIAGGLAHVPLPQVERFVPSWSGPLLPRQPVPAWRDPDAALPDALRPRQRS
jgi:hypothetical protein